MDTVTLSTKGQIVIPKAHRDRLGLQPGQRLAVVSRGQVVSLVPLGRIQDLRGMLRGADTAAIRDRSDRP